MTWKSSLFRQYYLSQGSPAAANSYAVNLRKADNYCAGLDEKLEELGAYEFLKWMESQKGGPFEGQNATNVRSAIRKYVGFVSQLSQSDAVQLYEQADSEDGGASSAVFRYEQELQQSVRSQIEVLELGLVIIDGGSEKSVATGRIDIFARDATGTPVIIELKAGLCPKGAIEQALAYATDVDDEGEFNIPSRVILVAGEFSERTLAAAKRISGLKLATYGISLSFASA